MNELPRALGEFSLEIRADLRGFGKPDVQMEEIADALRGAAPVPYTTLFQLGVRNFICWRNDIYAETVDGWVRVEGLPS